MKESEPMTVDDPVVPDDVAWRARQDVRARLMRLGVGALGLFWVCVLVLLMR